MTIRTGGNIIAGGFTEELLQTKANLNLDNSTAITNCITSIPQDIKLELNNGTLTLKAGSKVYVPNGAGVFDVVTISSDLTASTSGTASKLLFYNRTTNALDHWNTGDCKSGTSWSGVEGVFYNTSTNTIKYTVNSGSTWNAEYSLPIGIATTDGGFTSIDQIFNGFGYIGSTVFALPGVKGLIPNGRNADGSLKNIDFTTSSVLTFTNTYANVQDAHWLITSSSLTINGAYSYNEAQNLNYNQTTVDTACDFTISQTDSSGKIIAWNPKTPFHALDYNDSSTISGWSMSSSRYIDLTLGASGATYTAPANGCYRFNFNSSGTNGFIGMYARNTACATANSGRYAITATCQVSKGESVEVYYGNGSVSSFRFYYAEGENV